MVEEKSSPKKEKKKKTKRSKSKKVFVAKGKRKSSIARATIKEGKGMLRINSKGMQSYNTNKYVQEIIREPLSFLGNEVSTVDISVNVHGGGAMGQAQAARTAIANALALYFDEQKLKETFTKADRSLIVSDSRRVESKKYKGPKSRARYQKSYR